MTWCGNLIIATFNLTWCDIIQRVVIGFMVVMPGSYLFLQQDLSLET